MNRIGAFSAALCALVGGAACSGSQAPQLTGLPSTSTVPKVKLEAKNKMKRLVYITDIWGTSAQTIDVAGYPLSANGPTSPSNTLGGDKLGMEFESEGIAVSPQGAIALDGQDGPSGSAAVNVYAPGASGNVAPSTIYACAGLGEPLALTYDASGNLYAMNFNLPRAGSNSIFVFPSGSSSGCPANTQTIFGNNTRLFGNPGGIAVYRKKIYAVMVSTGTASAILEFPTSSNGNVTPTRRITGSKTTLQIPDGIAVNGTGEIFVVDNYSYSVDVFAPGAHGNAAPIRVIHGAHTQLYDPVGVGISKDGRIFVVNSSFNSNVNGDSITVYAANASGDAAPIAVIPGGHDYPKSEIGNPTALAIYQ